MLNPNQIIQIINEINSRSFFLEKIPISSSLKTKELVVNQVIKDILDAVRTEYSTTPITLPQRGSVIKNNILDGIKQIQYDSGFTMCSGCHTSCFTACAGSCSTGCSSGCRGGCGGCSSCGTDCGGGGWLCWGGCGHASCIENGCSGCSNHCSGCTGCSGNCSNSCSSNCSNGCSGTCSSGCASSSRLGVLA